MNHYDKQMVLSFIIFTGGVAVVISALPFPFEVVAGVICMMGGAYLGTRKL